jgi:hypothetical protein
MSESCSWGAIMAGYSNTPLAKKLGIKPGSGVHVLNEPEGFLEMLEPLPDGVLFVTEDQHLDVIVLFAASSTALESFRRLARALEPNGGLWVAWPKKSSGVPTDLTFEIVQHVGLSNGLVDNKVCAVDEIWTGLRFVQRLKNRPKHQR